MDDGASKTEYSMGPRRRAGKNPPAPSVGGTAAGLARAHTMRSPNLFATLALTFVIVSGCEAGDEGGDFEVPAGVTCANAPISGGVNGAELTAALGQAQAGDC